MIVQSQNKHGDEKKLSIKIMHPVPIKVLVKLKTTLHLVQQMLTDWMTFPCTHQFQMYNLTLSHISSIV